MIFKPGVKINGIGPEIVMAITVASQIYKEVGYELVVTSVTDGKHSRGSLHYIGHACDLRIRDIPSYVVKGIVDSLQAALTDEFDVVLEKDHIHIEFQPKT